jgi:hypothetical protein
VTDPNPNGPLPKNVYGTTILKSGQGTNLCDPYRVDPWVLPSSGCTISEYTDVHTTNIVIPNKGTLNVVTGGYLDVDLSTKYIKIENGGKLLVNGGIIN